MVLNALSLVPKCWFFVDFVYPSPLGWSCIKGRKIKKREHFCRLRTIDKKINNGEPGRIQTFLFCTTTLTNQRHRYIRTTSCDPCCGLFVVFGMRLACDWQKASQISMHNTRLAGQRATEKISQPIYLLWRNGVFVQYVGEQENLGWALKVQYAREIS